MIVRRRWSFGVLLGVLTACQVGERPMAPVSTDSTATPPVAPIVVRLWSDPASWPSGRVPIADEVVTIPQRVRMRLDVAPPALGGLDIQGELEADSTRDLSLTVEWIKVAGTFRIGSEAAPFPRRAVITLTGSGFGEAITGMGRRVLGVVPGGQLELHGPVRRAWTRLASSTTPGSVTLTVATDVDWRVGDRIAIAPSGFDPFQAEDRRISAVVGRTITVATPLQHPHYGEVQEFAGQVVDERAEVGLLSRGITIQGAGPLVDGVPLSPDGFGGHVMILAGATAKVEGVELVNMGQRGHIGHYPIHWHLAGLVDGQYIRNSVIWRSGNRCVTVHGTRNLTVLDNVCYDHVGHGYFLEEGAETGTILHGNLGILSRRPPAVDRLLPTDDRPATFWVTNPDNSVVGNVAAGSEGFGFWYALPEFPLGPSAGQPDRPTQTPLRDFAGNVAHSNHQTGLHVDDGPRADGTTTATSYVPRLGGAGGPIVPARFVKFLSYKNGNRGVWLRGKQHYLQEAILVDNHIAATFASFESYLTGSLVIGPSGNTIGSRDVYRGFEYYDGPVGARDVTFVGFDGRGQIPWSALGFNRRNAFSLSTVSASENLTFVQSTRLYIESPDPSKDGDKSAVFQDASGSVTGIPGRWVTANTPFLTTPDCTPYVEWNARGCPGPYLKVVVEGTGSSTAIAPVEVQRDGTATERFVGDGENRHRIAMMVMPSHSYDLTLGQRPTNLQVRVQEGRPNEWVLLSIATVAAPIRVTLNNFMLSPVDSPQVVAQGSGSTYAYDPVAGRLFVKLVVPNTTQFVQANFAIQLTP